MGWGPTSFVGPGAVAPAAPPRAGPASRRTGGGRADEQGNRRTGGAGYRSISRSVEYFLWGGGPDEQGNRRTGGACCRSISRSVEYFLWGGGPVALWGPVRWHRLHPPGPALPVRAQSSGRGARAQPDTAKRRRRHAGDTCRAPRYGATRAGRGGEHRLRRLRHSTVRPALYTVYAATKVWDGSWILVVSYPMDVLGGHDLDKKTHPILDRVRRGSYHVEYPKYIR
jgi:hypothetical protein